MIDDGGLSEAARRLGGWGPVERTGEGFVRSPLAVDSLIDATFGSLAGSLSLLQRALGHRDDAALDADLAHSWYGLHVEAVDAQLPSPWDPLSSSFRTADGSWIRTHANAPHHRRALLAALGCGDDLAEVTAAIARLDSRDLEADIHARGGVAAALRDRR